MKIKSKIITLIGCLTAIIGLSVSGALFASDITVYNNGNSSTTADSSSLMNPGSELFQSLVKTIEGNKNLYDVNQLVPLPPNGPWTSTQGAQCIQYIWNANSTLCFAIVTSNGTANVYEYACESYNPTTGTFNGMWNPSPLSLNTSLDNLTYFEPIFDSTGVNVIGSICLSPTDISITGLGITGLTQVASNSEPIFDGNSFASVSTLGWSATAGNSSLLNLYVTDAAGNNYFLNIPSPSVSGKYNAVSTPDIALGNSPLPWINSNQQSTKTISSETGETSGFVMSPYVNAGAPITVNSDAALYNDLAAGQYITPQNVLCSVLQNSVTGQYSLFTWMNDNNQDQWFNYPSFVSNTLPQVTSIQSNPDGIGGTYTINNNITYQLTGNSLTSNQPPWNQDPNLQDSTINSTDANNTNSQAAVVDVQTKDGTYGAVGNYTIWAEQNSQWDTAALGYNNQIPSSCMPWGTGNEVTSLAPYWNSDGTLGFLLVSANSTNGSNNNIDLFNPSAGGSQWSSIGISNLLKEYPSSVFANYAQDGTELSSMLALITTTGSSSPSDLQFAYVNPTTQQPVPDTWTDATSIPWGSGYSEAGFSVNSQSDTASSTLSTLMSSKSLESSPLKSGLIGDQNYSFDSNVKILSISYIGKDSSGKPVTNIVNGNIQCIPLQNSPYKYSISFVTSDFNGVLNANDVKVESALETVTDPSETASSNGTQSMVWANPTSIGNGTGQIYFYDPSSNGIASSWSSNLAPSNWNNQNIVLGAVNWDADGNYDGMIVVTTPDNSTYNVFYLPPNSSYTPSSTWESAGTLPSGFTPKDILGFEFDSSENLSYISIANSIYATAANSFEVYQYTSGNNSWNQVSTSGTTSSQNGDITIQTVSYAGNSSGDGDALYQITINGEALSSAMMFGTSTDYTTTFTTGTSPSNTIAPNSIYVNGSSTLTLADVMLDGITSLNPNQTYTVTTMLNITSLQTTARSTTNWGTVSSSTITYNKPELGLNGLEFTVTTGTGASYTARAFPLAGFTSFSDYTDGIMKIAPREFSFLWEGPQFIGTTADPTVTITENAHTYDSSGNVTATYPIKTYTAALPFFIPPESLPPGYTITVSEYNGSVTFTNGVCALPFNVTINDPENKPVSSTNPLYNELSFYNYNSAANAYNLIGGSPLIPSDDYTAVIPAAEMDVISGYPKYGYSYTPGNGREYYAVLGDNITPSTITPDAIDTYIIDSNGETLSTSSEVSINGVGKNSCNPTLTINPSSNDPTSFIPSAFGISTPNYTTEELSNIYPEVNGVVEFSPDYILAGTSNTDTDGICVILPEGLNPDSLVARYNLSSQVQGLCYGVNEKNTFIQNGQSDPYWISEYSLAQNQINKYSYQITSGNTNPTYSSTSYSIEEAINQIDSGSDNDYFFDQYGNDDELNVAATDQLSGSWNNTGEDADMEVQLNNTQPLPIYASSFLDNQNLGYTQISGVPNGGTLSPDSSTNLVTQYIGSGLFIPYGSDSAPAVCNVLTTLATGADISQSPNGNEPNDANCLWFNQAYPIIEVYGYGIDNTQLFNNSLNFMAGLTCNRIFFNLGNNGGLAGYSALNMLDMYWDNLSSGPTNAMIKTWGIEYNSASNVDNTAAEYTNSLNNEEIWGADDTSGPIVWYDTNSFFKALTSPLLVNNNESLLYALSGTGEFGSVDNEYTTSNSGDSNGICLNDSTTQLSNSPINYPLGFWLLNLNNPEPSVKTALTSIPVNFPTITN